MPVLKSFSGSSLPPWLIVTLEQRRQENRAYGDTLSPSWYLQPVFSLPESWCWFTVGYCRLLHFPNIQRAYVYIRYR